jgi:hypothetical protein
MQYCRACAIMPCYSLAMKRSDLRQCNFLKRRKALCGKRSKHGVAECSPNGSVQL